MLRQKAKVFKVHPCLTLDDLVPIDHFYRQLEAKLDLNFVRELVQHHYSQHMGRPSIDPVTFFKLHLIMFFEGIRSERQLMEAVQLNLAHRWYIGYDLDEPVPDHSSLSKIRTRYGFEVFHRFFEKIVELCIEAGLVWGKELYFDGTKVRANAAMTDMKPLFYVKAKQHLETVFDTTATVEANCEPALPEQDERISLAQRRVEKFDGTPLASRRSRWYQRITDYWMSPTDPDASPMSRFTGDIAKLGYHTHYVVDGGKARIILAALVTPASVITPRCSIWRDGCVFAGNCVLP